ncbi:hypothetical protein DRQ25_17850 [Candidatus Fermentibacteria bacterium]|nr:MAG: hypothetical protein DRQ25_17850 [Candidatus Fermentibacteria bacterium]
MTQTDNLTNILLIVIGLNFLMFVVGQGLIEVGGYDPFSLDQNLLQQYNQNGTYTLPSDVADQLPSGEATTISVDTGLSYTDTFTANKVWWLRVPGLGFVASVLSGPALLLGLAHFPPALAWAVASMWYIISLFVLVGYIIGR